MLRRNVLANAVGVTWLTALSLLVTPLQVRILGIEAYGLLGFFAALQALLNVFDLGGSSTVTREVAGDVSPNLQRSREVVAGLAGWYWSIGLILGATVFLGAEGLARGWLGLGGSRAELAAVALRLTAVAIVVRWPVSFYASAIAGRQRFDLLNLLSAGVATIGLLGGAAVIVATESLTAFLVWRAATAALEIAGHVAVCRRVLPGLRLRPGFDWPATRSVWRFAVGAHLVTVTSLVLAQADRFVVSRMLPISALGYYSLARSVAIGLTLVQGVMTSAIYPAFARDVRTGQHAALAERCAKATQAVGYVVAQAGAVLIFFGDDLLRMWVGAPAAEGAFPTLRLLTVGALLGSPLTVLSTLAVGAGQLRIPLRVNAIGLLLYLPALHLLTSAFASVGAAAAWACLQGFMVVAVAPAALGILGVRRTWAWLGRHAAPFALIALAVFAMAKGAANLGGHGILATVIAGGSAGLVSVGAGFLALHPDLRAQAGRWLSGAREGDRL